MLIRGVEEEFINGPEETMFEAVKEQNDLNRQENKYGVKIKGGIRVLLSNSLFQVCKILPYGIEMWK